MEKVKAEAKPEFNLYKTLNVIENDKALDEIFRDNKITMSYHLLRTAAKQNALPPETIDRLQEIFDRIIIKNKKPLALYINADDETKSDKLPKHYGKKKVLEDINKNHKKSELDSAMLALNDMRNIYAKFKRMAIKDKVNGTRNLTNANCRDIIAVVRILNNKAKEILNK